MCLNTAVYSKTETFPISRFYLIYFCFLVLTKAVSFCELSEMMQNLCIELMDLFTINFLANTADQNILNSLGIRL